MSGLCLTRLCFTTTYACRLSFIQQRQGTIQRCLFLELAMYMNGHNDLNSHTSRYLTGFVLKSGHDPKSVRGISEKNWPVVEEIVQRNIFIYNFKVQEEEYVGELARKIIGRLDETVKLMRFHHHIIHTIDVESFFKCFRCPSCDTFSARQATSIGICGDARIEWGILTPRTCMSFWNLVWKAS